MDKIRTSLFGYNKTNVDNIIREKEEMINTQKKDIEYLQSENNSLKSQLKANKNSKNS